MKMKWWTDAGGVLQWEWDWNWNKDVTKWHTIIFMNLRREEIILSGSRIKKRKKKMKWEQIWEEGENESNVE